MFLSLKWAHRTYIICQSISTDRKPLQDISNPDIQTKTVQNNPERQPSWVNLIHLCWCRHVDLQVKVSSDSFNSILSMCWCVCRGIHQSSPYIIMMAEVNGSPLPANSLDKALPPSLPDLLPGWLELKFQPSATIMSYSKHENEIGGTSGLCRGSGIMSSRHLMIRNPLSWSFWCLFKWDETTEDPEHPASGVPRNFFNLPSCLN